VRALLLNRPLKRYVYILLLIISIACGKNLKSGPDSESQSFHLVVLHTNDTHGHPVKFFHYPAPDVGGLPARATLIKEIRKENRNVLVMDAGDLNTGRAESNYFRARPDIEGYNRIGYDAMVLGNHEFDHPISVLKEQMETADFPFLSANVKSRGGGYLALPYIVKEFGGVKVAIFGLTTKETEISGNPEHIQNLVFEDEIEVAGKLVPKLKKEAHVVIALVHMGIYPSRRRGSKRLASEVSGIDLIVDGHTHTRLDSPILVRSIGSDHETIIVQAWKWGLVLGRVDLWIRNKRVTKFKFEAIPVNLKTVERKEGGTKVYGFIGKEIKEDQELLKLLQPYVDEVESLLSEVVGHAEGTFFAKGLRSRETALGDMVADSMLWFTKDLGIDFAVQNGGGIRADLPKGSITKGLIHEILPFDNSVVVLTLKGSDVLSLFDHIAHISRGRGAFPQVSEGISFTINREAGRCEDILIKGKPVDPLKTYKIATNSYLASGGDGYKVFLNAVHRYDFSLFQRDVFIGYIKHLGGRIRPEVKGRIRIKGRREVYVSFKRAA